MSGDFLLVVAGEEPPSGSRRLDVTPSPFSLQLDMDPLEIAVLGGNLVKPVGASLLGVARLG